MADRLRNSSCGAPFQPFQRREKYRLEKVRYARESGASARRTPCDDDGSQFSARAFAWVSSRMCQVDMRDSVESETPGQHASAISCVPFAPRWPGPPTGPTTPIKGLMTVVPQKL